MISVERAGSGNELTNDRQTGASSNATWEVLTAGFYERETCSPGHSDEEVGLAD